MRRKLFIYTFLLCLLFIFETSEAELSSNLQIIKETNPKTHMIMSETYVDSQGNAVIASDKGYATIAYTYNLSNQLKEKRFLDTEGNTVDCAKGYAYIQYEFKSGKTYRTVYYTAEGQPAMGPDGYSVREIIRGTRGVETDAYDYDTNGNILIHCETKYVDIKKSNLIKSKSWYNDQNEPTTGPEGYARVEYEYNKRRKIHITYFNADGSLFYNKKEGYAEKEEKYEKGNIVELSFYGADGNLTAGPSGYARATYAYAQGGKETLTMYYNADGSLFFTNKGYCGIKQIKENRRVIDESYYQGEGVRGLCIDGYSRITKRYTLRGQIILQCFYDEQDQLMIPEKIGYAKEKNTYNTRYLLKTEYFGTDEKPMYCPSGYAVAIHSYKNKVKTETVYYDIDGKTIINGIDGYAKIVYKYDDNRQCTGQVYYDAEGNHKAVYGEADEVKWILSGKNITSESYWFNGQPVNGEKGYHEVRMEYTSDNKTRKEFYYDINGNITKSLDGYAGFEKLYDSAKKEMAVLYYNENGQLIQSPGKEYAYVMTITEKDKKALDAEIEEQDDQEEETDSDEEKPASAGIIYIEYYGTNRKLMNQSSGYAYLIRETDAQGRTVQESYYDKDGNKAVLKNGYDEYRQVYTSGSRPSRIEYYKNGELTLYNNNYAAIEYEYNKNGNVISERYYNTDFQPASCKNGYEMIQKEYNEKQQIICETYHDHSGQPMANNKGVFGTVLEYNRKGKVIKETYIDETGETMPCKQGYASTERIYYTDESSVLGTLYYNEKGDLIKSPGNEYAYMLTIPKEEYDDIIEGVVKTVYIEFYGTDRKMMNLSIGYASMIRQTDKEGRIVREVYYNTEGQKTLARKSYDEIRQSYINKKLPNRIEYYRNGQLILRDVGYAVVEREYDDNGNTIVEKYYDTEYQPTFCTKGYEVIHLEYNEKKQISHEAYYDHTDKSMVNKKGVYQMDYEYNKENRVAEEKYYDYYGKPMRNNKGVYCTAFEYDKNGNVTKEKYFDAKGEPMLCTQGYASLEKKYTEQGSVMGTLYYNEKGDITRSPGNEYAYMMTTPKENYDDVIEGVVKTVYIEFFGTDQELMNLSVGYAAMIRQTDKQGRVIREVYFDKNGQKALVRKAYDEIRQSYIDNDLPNRIEYYRSGKLVLRDVGYAVVEREYDETGNVIVERYYDIDVQPTECNNGYEMIRKAYNQQKLVSKEAYFDHTGKPRVNNKGFYQIAYEYNEQGKMIKEMYYDADGKPMANKSGYIMIEWEYDENGNKISQTNYPMEEQNDE